MIETEGVKAFFGALMTFFADGHEGRYKHFSSRLCRPRFAANLTD